MSEEKDHLDPIVTKLLVETGILFKVFEKRLGYRMNLPDRVKTQQDKSSPVVYSQLKAALLCQLSGPFIDKHFPILNHPEHHQIRGELVSRLGVEIYRLLTDGLSIDAVRVGIEDPDPHAQGTKQ